MKVTFDWLVLAPVLAPALGALLVLLVDAIAPRAHSIILALSLTSLGVGIAVAGWAAGTGETVSSLCLDPPEGSCLYAVPPSAGILQLTGAAAAAVVLLMLLGDRVSAVVGDRVGSPPAEPLAGGRAVSAALVLAAAAGAAGVVAAQDLGSWLVTLELATVPMVALVALAGRRRAVQGALTLLVTSVLSFALLALGVALWVVATGSATFTGPGVGTAWTSPEHRPVLVVAVLVILAGLGFKLSLVPFHTWTPVTYAGAALPVTLALATISKVAALGALITVVRALASTAQDPTPVAVTVALSAVALVSMTFGALVALRQVDPVRLLAWSAIGQAGWVVLPLAALSSAAADAAAGYLVAYVIATTVAFLVVHRVHGPVAAGAPQRARELSHTGGLARNHALLGGVLVLALLSLAGLPPGVIGLVAKIAVLGPVVAAGLWPLAVAAVVAAVLGVAVYLRWVAILLGAGRSTGPLQPMAGSRVALVLASAALVATSVLPALVFR